MMKKVLLFIMNLSGIAFYAQDAVELRNYSPKSPEASAFTKYGDYPVDLSTGVANISIPIYTIKAGEYSLPISLDYHPSGIKVADDATWVGLGWNLSAGAQIILDVRDQPDEYMPEGAYNNIPDGDAVNTYIANNPDGYYDNYFQNLKQESWVRDVYNFSSPTASGKFIIDKIGNNYEITIYPPDAFKVVTEGGMTTRRFIITDPSGNIYYFTNTREKSQIIQQYQKPLYTSAWYVDKVETPKHDIIEFTYIDGGEIDQTNYGDVINHTSTHTPNGYCILNEMPGGGQAPTPEWKETLSPLQNSLNIQHTETKKISIITFNGGRILFDSSSGRYDFYNPNSSSSLTNGPKKLDNIRVQAKNQGTNTLSNIKNLEFNYSYFDSQTPNSTYMKTHRLKLESISDVLFTGNEETTEFIYSDVELPAKDSKSTDFWGYYNGKGNSNRIPRHYIFVANSTGFGGNYEPIGNADRTVVPSKIEAGMLKSIKYPTKGTTEFEYEPNQYWGVNKFERYSKVIVSAPAVYGVGYPQHSNPGTIWPPGVEDYDGTCPEGTYVQDCITRKSIAFTAANARADLSFVIGGPINSQPGVIHYQYARVYIWTANNGIIYDTDHWNEAYDDTHHFTSLDGAGMLIVEAYGAPMSVLSAVLTLYNNDTSNKNCYGMGVRIKSITNKDHNGSFIGKKKYDYKNSQHPQRSSGKALNDISAWFHTSSTTASIKNCTYLYVTDWQTIETESIYSNSISGLEGNSVVYEEVIEKSVNQQNESNGYTYYKFTTDADYLHDTKGLIKYETAYKRGKLLLKEVYKIKPDNTYSKINQLINEYFEDDRKISYVKGYKLFQHYALTGSFYFSGHYYWPTPLNTMFESAGYNLPVKWFYQKSAENTDYFYDENDDLAQTVVSTTNYFYDNPDHLQLTRTEMNNSRYQTLKTINHYPDDLITDPLMQNLKDQNRIAEVIRTESYNNNDLLSVKNTIYKNWGNNTILPEIIQTAKGDASLENRIRFTTVDPDNGNPVELKKENGMPVVYIWDHQGIQPLAKIEGLSFSEIPGSLISDIKHQSESGSENSVRSALNSLRNDPAMAGAMVTTFIYKPLVGIQEITDPKGIVTSYDYDTAGRLTGIKDADGKFLSQTEYHYKN